jgi:hypothetical protein
MGRYQERLQMITGRMSIAFKKKVNYTIMMMSRYIWIKKGILYAPLCG